VEVVRLRFDGSGCQKIIDCPSAFGGHAAQDVGRLRGVPAEQVDGQVRVELNAEDAEEAYSFATAVVPVEQSPCR